MNQITVILDVRNDTSGAVTKLTPRSPLVQAEAGADFVLGQRPSPRTYAVVDEGDSVTFQWQGQLNSAGAVGISVSAAAVDPNRQPIETTQVDCGTIGGSQPSPSGPGNPASTREATECAACHTSPQMAFVANKWLQSKHAASYGALQGNTYCATCHSPFQADADATPTKKEPIAQTQWQAVTCSACHPPEAQQTEWKSPIATYDVATRTYTSVPLGDANELCTHCHTGDFAPQFAYYGRVMFYAGVRCIDCHMAKIPADDPTVGQPASHDLLVAANLPYSCGTYPGGCHARRPQAWAEKYIAAGGIHVLQAQ